MTLVMERPTPGRHRAADEPKERRRRNWLAPLLVLIGIVVMAYPVVGTYFHNVQQVEVAENYRATTSTGVDYGPIIEAARHYNETSTGGPILDPWLARVSKDNAPYQDYLSQLAPNGPGKPMSVLAIPSINSTLPIYHGTDPDTLTHGVGHLYGSALPIGTVGSRTILTGHTGMTNATLFDNLVDVKTGDRMYMATFGLNLAYEVDDIQIVLPDEINTVQPIAGEDLLTLVTCTPYGINSHRLIVTGHRIEVPVEEQQEAFQTVTLWQWWMWIAVGVAAFAILVLLLGWLAALLRRRRRDDDSADPLSGSPAL